MSLFSLINRTMSSNLNKAGIQELSSHHFMPHLLNEDSLVVDLGANTGEFYTNLTSHIPCNCIAVEASPKLFSELPSRFNTSTYNYAISKADGPIEFYISENNEASSLNKAIAKNWGLSNTVRVEGLTFESFKKKHQIPQRIDLLKIDIEGAELDLLENLTSETLAGIVQIPIEFHDFLDNSPNYKTRMHKEIKKLKKNNFLIVKISNSDWREVLCINTNEIRLSFHQKVRLKILHPCFQLLKRIHIRLGSALK